MSEIGKYQVIGQGVIGNKVGGRTYEIYVGYREAPFIGSLVGGEEDLKHGDVVNYGKIAGDSNLIIIFPNYGGSAKPGAAGIFGVDLPAWDWIQSLVSPYLCLSTLAACNPPTVGVSTAVTIAQDAQAAAGMERLLGIVSLGDCWLMVNYRANTGLTEYPLIRIRAYEWNMTVRWTAVLGIVPHTFAAVTSIPYSSNCFWDPVLESLIVLDYEAYAWPIPDTSVAPFIHHRRDGPFRRFAGYAPGGSMLHHNGDQLIHYPYTPGTWGVLPDVKIHGISDYIPAGHSPYAFGIPSSTMVNTNRFLNRSWCYSQGYWYCIISSRGNVSGTVTSALNFIKISAETGEVVLNTQPRWGEIPSEYIPTPLHDTAQASAVPAVFGGHPQTTGEFVLSGKQIQFKIYDPSTQAYLGTRGYPTWERVLVNFSSASTTQESWLNPYGISLPTRSYGVVQGSSVGGAPLTNSGSSFTPLPQPASVANLAAAVSGIEAGVLYPGVLVNGQEQLVYPHYELAGYGWPSDSCPPFLLTSSWTLILDDAFEILSATVTDGTYTIGETTFNAYLTTMNVRLSRGLFYYAASYLSYFTVDGEYAGKVEVSPRILNYSGPSLDGARNSISPVIPQWADLIPFPENIWQVAAGMTGSIRFCEFVIHDAREHVNTEPRLMFTVIQNQRVVWRSPLLGNTDRHATTETNIALQPFYPGKYKFQYSGKNLGQPQIRVWTDTTNGKSFAIIGLWMRKTTNGTTNDTAASDQYSTNIWIYEVTNPASPVLIHSFYEANNVQGSVNLPKGEDFARMMIAEGQIFWVSKVGSDWKIQKLV